MSHGGKGECISMESDAENPTRRWTWDRTRKEGSDRACKSRVYRARPITTVVPYETIRVPPKISVALYLRNKPDRDLSRYRFIASGTDDSPRERGERGNRRGSTTHRIEEKRGSRRIETRDERGSSLSPGSTKCSKRVSSASKADLAAGRRYNFRRFQGGPAPEGQDRDQFNEVIS